MTYLFRRYEDDERESIMSNIGLEKRLMIGITAGEWEGIHHRPHHMMKRAAKDGWDVLFIESPMTYLSPLKDKEKLKHWRNSSKGIRKMEKGLNILTLPPFLPFGNKNRKINKINQKKLMACITQFIEKGQYDAIDIYTFLPQTVDLLPLIDYDRLIYDCVDDHVSFSGIINKELVLAMEKELSEEADVTFYTAKQLQKEKQEWAKRSLLVPNGAEYEHFAVAEKISKDEGNIPQDIVEYIHPGKTVIGFVGGIGDWVDLQLMYEAAKLREDLLFLIIGPVDTNVDEEILRQKNVVFLGSRPYSELPYYIAFFDACMISFKLNELTKSVNPIKLYEYLSTGKPILSTPIPEVVVYKDHVEIVENPQELLSRIDMLQNLDETTRMAHAKARQAIGKNNSWDARWQMIKENMSSQPV